MMQANCVAVVSRLLMFGIVTICDTESELASGLSLRNWWGGIATYSITKKNCVVNICVVESLSLYSQRTSPGEMEQTSSSLPLIRLGMKNNKYNSPIDRRQKGVEKCTSCPEFPQIVDGIDYCIYATTEGLNIDYSRMYYVSEDSFPRLYNLVYELRKDRTECNDLLYYDIPSRSQITASIDYVLNYAKDQKVKLLHPELLCLKTIQRKKPVKRCYIDIYQTFLYYIDNEPDEYLALQEYLRELYN